MPRRNATRVRIILKQNDNTYEIMLAVPPDRKVNDELLMDLFGVREKQLEDVGDVKVTITLTRGDKLGDGGIMHLFHDCEGYHGHTEESGQANVMKTQSGKASSQDGYGRKRKRMNAEYGSDKDDDEGPHVKWKMGRSRTRELEDEAIFIKEESPDFEDYPQEQDAQQIRSQTPGVPQEHGSDHVANPAEQHFPPRQPPPTAEQPIEQDMSNILPPHIDQSTRNNFWDLYF